MPVVPLYVANETLDSAANTMPRPDVSTAGAAAAASLGNAVKGLGGELAQVAAQFQKRQNEKDAFDGRIMNDRNEAERDQKVAELRNKMPADGTGFRDAALKVADETWSKYAQQMPASVRDRYEAAWQANRVRLDTAYSQGELTQRQGYHRTTIDGVENAYMGKIANDPNGADAALNDAKARIMESALPEAEKQQRIKAVEQKFRSLEAETRHKNDPVGASVAFGRKVEGIGHGAINKVWSGPVAKAKEVYDTLRSLGATDKEALMLTGAAASESAFNPAAVHDNGTGYGLFGHRLERRSALFRHAGTTAPTTQQQLAFALQELRSRPEAGRVNAATSAEELTAAQMDFEMPQGYSRGAPHAGMNWNGRLGTIRRFAGLAGMPSETQGSAKYAAIPFEQQQRIIAGAERNAAMEQRQEEINRKTEQVAVKSAIADDLASIERTGKSLDDKVLSRDKVASAFGEDYAREWEADRNRHYRYHGAVKGMDLLSEAEIARRVADVEPVPGSPGYASDIKVYEQAKAAAAATMKRREDDPAGAVENVDIVASAREAAAGKNDVAANETLIRARLEAQRMIGIPAHKISPVTAGEIKGYAKIFQEMSSGQAKLAEQRAMAQSVAEDIVAKYGSYSPDVLKRVMYDLSLSDDASRVMQRIFTEAMDGRKPVLRPEESSMLNVHGQERTYAEARQPRVVLPIGPAASLPTMAQRDMPVPNNAPPRSHVEALTRMANADTKEGQKVIADFDQLYGSGAAYFYLNQHRAAIAPKPVEGRPGNKAQVWPALRGNAQ